MGVVWWCDLGGMCEEEDGVRKANVCVRVSGEGEGRGEGEEQVDSCCCSVL